MVLLWVGLVRIPFFAICIDVYQVTTQDLTLLITCNRKLMFHTFFSLFGRLFDHLSSLIFRDLAPCYFMSHSYTLCHLVAATSVYYLRYIDFLLQSARVKFCAVSLYCNVIRDINLSKI